MTNLFQAAKDAKPATVKAPKKNDKQEINVAGLHQVAAIDAMIKALEGMKANAAAGVKVTAMDEFVKMIAATGKKPESFRGIENNASASVELRKRGENSRLNEAQVEQLKQLNIPVGEVVAVQERFFFDETVLADADKAQKLSDALTKAGFKDIVKFQPKQSAFVVTDETVDAVCAMKANAPREVVELVTVTALKPKLEVTDMNDLFFDLQKMVTGRDVRAELQAAKEQTEAAKNTKKTAKVAA